MATQPPGRFPLCCRTSPTCSRSRSGPQTTPRLPADAAPGRSSPCSPSALRARGGSRPRRYCALPGTGAACLGLDYTRVPWPSQWVPMGPCPATWGTSLTKSSVSHRTLPVQPSKNVPFIAERLHTSCMFTVEKLENTDKSGEKQSFCHMEITTSKYLWVLSSQTG